MICFDQEPYYKISLAADGRALYRACRDGAKRIETIGGGDAAWSKF